MSEKKKKKAQTSRLPRSYLSALLVERKWTWLDLAIYSGIPESSLAKLAYGRRGQGGMKVKTLMALAAAFGIDGSQMLSLENEYLESLNRNGH